MKKSYFLLVVFAFLGWSVKTQTFIYDVIPEGIFPDANSGKAKKVSHVSAALTNGLKAYSWCSDDPGSPGGVVLFEPNNSSQFFPIPGVRDLEVVFCGGVAIASYFIPGEGVFVTTYRYIPVKGMFEVLHAKKKISATGKTPRISGTGKNSTLDLRITEKAVITWEESNGIMTRIMKSFTLAGLNNVMYGENELIEGTAGGKIPDISVELGADVLANTVVYLSYFDPSTSKIKTLRRDMGSITTDSKFRIVDEYTATGPVSYIDICQPHRSNGWAYAFAMNNAIFVRGYSASYSSAPSTFSITNYSYLDTIEQRKPSIAYSHQEGNNRVYDRVLVAWSMKGKLHDEGLFYVNRKIDGGYITPNGSFHIVPSNRGHNVLYGQVAVSKNIPSNLNKLIAYSADDISSGLEMRYKTLSPSAAHSRISGETADVEQLTTSSLVVYPNPFNDFFQLEAEDYEQGQQLDLQLVDFAGRIVFSTKGDVAAVNTQLKTACPELNAGVYIVKVNGNEQHTFKIVKQ